MQARPFPLDRVADVSPPTRGLTAGEVVARRTRYGPNDVVETARRAWWTLVRDTAGDPMLWFLVGTSVLYGAIGERLEAATLAAAIVPLALMDAYLHRRTSLSTEGLRTRLAAWARVRRDGDAVKVSAAAVVPGDLVLIEPGELIPADGVVVAGSDIQVEEAALSGESVPVRKHPCAWPPLGGAEPPVAVDQWCFAGTRLLSGRATVRVGYTGAETLYGEIARAAATGGTARTAVQRAIADLLAWLIGIAAAVCVLLAIVRLRQGYGWVDAVMSALTLGVAAFPEEFPVVFTFFLGVGVYRLARRQALVRRAAAVENIGRISTICSDKTGTLTEGRLVLAHLVPAAGFDAARLLAIAAQASRQDSGDPLDVAIGEAALAGRTTTDVSASVGALPTLGPSPARVATFPYTEDRKRESAVLRGGAPALLAVTKGALETLLAMADVDASTRDELTESAAMLAGGGHKVIACAWGALDAARWAGEEPDRGFTIAGLLAFEDPVRPGVAAAVGRCRAAGIRAVMVTGDHPLTALAVAREIGLGGDAPRVVTGDDIERLVASGGFEAAPPFDVVARATPAQKLALVRGFQAAGEIVAVTGDGVNDVPALQTADVGIAMGERGTQSAREIAPIVLLDDDFGTIVGAIAEGRQLFHNLRQSFRYLLMIHVPLVATAALIPLAGYPLLYLPIHIVWLELIIHPTALLAFQAPAPAPGTALAPVIRERRIRLFTSPDLLGIAMVGVALTTMVAGGYLRVLHESGDVAHARAIALLTLSFGSAALAATLSGLRTSAARAITIATMALALLLVQTPACATRFHVTPLHLDDLAGVGLASLLVTGLAALLARYAVVLTRGER